MKQPLIQLDSIVKNYKTICALNQISCNIYPGVTGLLGPNGAGKSTLIKVLLGLVKVSSGYGTILGYQLGKQGRKIRQLVGYMPEDDCYIPGLTGVEVVRFSATLAGLPKVEALRRSHEILDFCGMQQERYRNIETYSTGMRQKIKFACSIVHDPQLLILDEPTSGLDPEERESLLNRIRVLSRQFGKTVILSTHILPDVQSTCDHVVIISRGQLRISDSLENLSRPASPTITLSVVGDKQVLADALENIGLETTSGDRDELTIEGDLNVISDQIWQAAKTSGCGIRNMTPSINSLEEIFIQAIKESGHADA